MAISLNWFVTVGIYLVVIGALCEGTVRTQKSQRSRRISSRRLTPCPDPNFENGHFYKRRYSTGFYCNYGYKLLGKRTLACRNGRYECEIPVCGKNGCNVTVERSNGTVQLQHDRMTLKLSCKFGFDLAGSETAYCNGKRWDRELGDCRPDIGHSKVCDFETADLCGWSQDRIENDFLWVRRNGWNTNGKLKFGPKHDHTIGKPLEGFYMVAEATNSLSEQKSRFWSPIHSQADSVNACFRFFYHMFGAHPGRLRVFVKPIDQDIDFISSDSNLIYFDNRYSSNQWHEGFFLISPVSVDFQIVFEASVSGGRITDIAIDDVALLNGTECIESATTKAINEEIDGIFDIRSCSNRCSETQSVILGTLNRFMDNDDDHHFVEQCDCHPDCDDIDTCCPDYQLVCSDSIQSTTDSTTTDITEALTELPLTSKIIDDSMKSTNAPTKLPTASPRLAQRSEQTPATNTASIRQIVTTKTPQSISKYVTVATDKPTPKVIPSKPMQLNTIGTTHKTNSTSVWTAAKNIMILIIALCALLIALLLIPYVSKPFELNKWNPNALSSHSIKYIPNKQIDALQIDFDAQNERHNENLSNAEVDVETAAECSESENMDLQVNKHDNVNGTSKTNKAILYDRFKQHFHRSKSALGRYRNLDDHEHTLES